MDGKPGEVRPRISAWAYALPLLALAWLVITPGLIFGAVIASAPFYGEQPSAAEVQESRHLLMEAAVVAVGLPLVGYLLSRRLQLRWVAVLFGVALGIGCLVMLFALGATATSGGGRS